MSKYKRWELVEDTILRVWSDEENCEQLAERLGRTVGSVKYRLQILGLRKKNVYQNKVWTLSMEKYLKDRAGKQSSKSIAKNLGVSYRSLKTKSSRMGVSLRVEKYRLWGEGEISLLTYLVQKAQTSKKISWDQISQSIGRTPFSCRKKANELGLNLGLRKEWMTTELSYVHRSRTLGVSYKEISLTLNRPENSIRKRYSRYKKEKEL